MLILNLREYAEPKPIGVQLQRGVPDAKDLQRSIRKRLTRTYEQRSRGVLKDLYKGSGKEPPKFSLRARWKSKDLDKQAKRMSQGLQNTLANERVRLEAKYAGNPNKAASEFDFVARRKTDELLDIIDAEADLQATVDQAVHTGAFDPKTAKVMHFVGPADSKTCPVCHAVMGGNPWTINDATNYGAKMHPHCRHDWQDRWHLDDAEKKVMRRRIKDGELKGWNGKGVTPGPVSAKDAAKVTDRYKGAWPMQKRDVVRMTRKAGVPEETVNAMLNNKQLARRLKRQVAKGEAPSKRKHRRALTGRKGAQQIVDVVLGK